MRKSTDKTINLTHEEKIGYPYNNSFDVSIISITVTGSSLSHSMLYKHVIIWGIFLVTTMERYYACHNAWL